jgi:GNAT superfamily N-acetyltransferase
MKGVIVRIATEDDYGGIAGLMEELFPRKAMNAGTGDVYFVAEACGAIVGFAHIVLRGEKAVLQGIGVTEELRRKGIGALLLESAIAYCREIGQSDVCLKVKALNPAARLYAKKGFFVMQFGDVCSMTKKEAT